MKIAYVVTSGVYSDYQIHGVFSSKEIAQKYIDDMRTYRLTYKWDREPTIEEYDMDYVVVSKFMTVVVMEKDGTVVETETTFDEGAEIRDTSFINSDKYLRSVVRTNDKKRAIKVTNERRAMLIANGEWGNTWKAKCMFEEYDDEVLKELEGYYGPR